MSFDITARLFGHRSAGARFNDDALTPELHGQLLTIALIDASANDLQCLWAEIERRELNL